MAARKSQDLPPSAELHPLGQVAATTHADNVRHAYLRASFMNALLRDPRISELFDTWGKESRLYTAADAVARAANDVARATKVSHWMDPIHINEDDVNRAAPLVDTFEAVSERFYLMLQPDNRPSLQPRPSAFVRDTLKLRWSWLAYELLDSFFRHVSARAFGTRIVRSFTVVHQSPPAPQLDFQVTFATREGESVAMARERLFRSAGEANRAYRAAWRELARAERNAVGRRPNTDTRYLQHWAEWFYRAKVKRPPDTISALAREYSPRSLSRAAHELPRRLVQLGISNANRLLSQGVYEICDTPTANISPP